MSDKTLFAVRFSAQSGCLITCLIFLLLAFSLVELTHEDHCEHTVCAVCTVSLGSLLPSLDYFTAITLKPVGVVRNEATISARQVFLRPYDGRAPPLIS